MNRLAQEKSPYLLQHAHNLVDWYPWGPEAFHRARQLDQPIFLSVGYSTCHWCHVMERESFEDERIAALLNAHFVPVKVDREERPDVDRIYMLFVQASTGSGGWPMSVWLTPDLKPFYGGTYYRPAQLADLLGQVARSWKENREKVVQAGESVISQLKERIEAPGDATGLDATVLESGFQSFRRAFDPRFGGFGGAPKFPQPSILNFLLREHARTGNREALDMVLFTLRAMAAGGIHDQVGGGFHRYSVDERWQAPHFEKMLYDQAQLALSYVEAFELCGDEFFAGVARDILEYVLRDMTDAEGGFYSAEDADSAYYQIGSLAARAQRPRPHRDDKILAAWNGLMISAFAVAASVLDEPRYLAAARAAASFVLLRLYDSESGSLLRRFRQEEAAIAGFLDDYAFLTQGLLDLCEATLDSGYLTTAERLTDKQRELFEDREQGGFYSTSGEDESLVLRLKDGYDGAEPSGNSVSALNLLRLAQITGRGDFRDSMEKTFRAFATELSASSAAVPGMLVALGHSLGVPLPARIGARHYSGGNMERPGAVTLKGNPLTLMGPELHVGDKAPDFDVVDKSLSAVNLAKTGAAVRIFSVVPSLDTPVCDAQTKRFNDETAKLPGVEVVTVSMDLPFAQARWCGAFGVDRIMMLSDHKNGSFGTNYGTLIKELRIESRAIFVVDKANLIRHVQYVKEVTDHPDYEETLKAVRSLTA